MSELKNKITSPFSFSQTSLQDYADCARRFQLRYVEQLSWPAIESEPVLENERRQQEGQVFHRLVQQQLIGLPVEKLTRLASSPDLSRWWENYLHHQPDLTGFTLYPELTLSVRLSQYRLVAKYDLVAVIPGSHVLIFDWKTYRKRPKDEWMAARWQTRIYRALLVEAGSHLNGSTGISPEQIEMTYWYADFPAEPFKLSYNSTQFKRDWDAITKIVKEIDGLREFPMTDDLQKCEYCSYRSYCERGSSTGTNGESESELDEVDINLEQVQEIEF